MQHNPIRTVFSLRAWPDWLFGRWWRSQSASRQDRFATLGPLISVVLFLVAISLALLYLRYEEVNREQESVKRDTEVAQSIIRLRLIENQEQLVRMARSVVGRSQDAKPFFQQSSRNITRERPEITNLVWMDEQRAVRASYCANCSPVETGVTPDDTPAALPEEGRESAAEAAFLTTRLQRLPTQAVYSRAFKDAYKRWAFQIQIPLLERNNFAGVLIAELSIDELMRRTVPPDVAARHAISFLNDTDQQLASTVDLVADDKAPSVRSSISYQLHMTPGNNGMALLGQGSRTAAGFIGSTLFLMVAGLSVLTVWMLLGTWRHMRRGLRMRNALVSETNFRRAMENSMLTGMRAMDMEGRITYVNPAFSDMTGFSEAELVGRQPPMPYWPPDHVEENGRLLQQELQGRSPAGGIEVKVMRKDSLVFDARMYVSPLIDPKGVQTGWMTSMTNITESKRTRDQLTASQERFTTVLEGLDAAVSVLSVQQGELLFANRSYRLWFGNQSQGHALLAGAEAGVPYMVADLDESVDNFGGLPTQELTEAGSDSREVYIEELQKWFEVRARYLQWTDGRLTQMLIATDITARRNADALAASQAEKAQVTSRLVTMGEMASSVAHELNQPLTAITNYCNGIISRVNNNAIETPDLIAALEKTARQAQRAGQIIHRIRAFVKRSEPQRQAAQAQTIIDDTVELAGIELRRRMVNINVYVAKRLPTLMVDPILIEQVLLNLLKNAAEAIDDAKLPSARRNIELRVVPVRNDEEGEAIEFSVTDMGPGLKDEVSKRLYEAFFSTKVDGLGIGLSLCRSIIESHHGRIKAVNMTAGDAVVGCRFWFTLPLLKVNFERSPVVAQTADSEDSADTEPSSLNKAEITS
jgi:PAS domain S-box-containing protein